MSNLPQLPDLGQFFGDQGGPGTVTPNTPQNENRPTCPFADEQMGEFCSLDGAMCPFVGFNYRRCRKYTNNMAKGNMKALEPSANNSSGGGPPRNEGVVTPLTEARRKKKAVPKNPAKKGGSKKAPSIAGVKVSDLPPEVQALAGHIAHTEHDPHVSDQEKKKIVKDFFMSHRGPDVEQMYYTPDDPQYVEQGRQASLLAAALHLLHGVAPGKAKVMGMDFATIAHHEAGERFRNPNQAEMNAAMADAGNEATDFWGNPQGHRNRGGPTSTDPEDIGATHADRSAGQTFKPPPSGEGDPVDPNAPPRPGRRFDMLRRRGVQQQGTRHDEPGQRTWHKEPEPEPKEKKVQTPYRGSKFTSPQRTGEKMTYEQFDQFLADHVKGLNPQELKDVMAGIGKPGVAANTATAIDHLKKLAAKRADIKDYKSIADAQKMLWGRIESIHDIRQNEVSMRRAWDANLRMLSKMPLGDQQAYKMAIARTSQDPKARDKAASFMNKMVDRAYDLETKTMKVGKNELTTFVRKITLPEFSRSDYETMRMAEQMGLAAIQKQHQYGKGYGRWNTIQLFFKQLVMPFVTWWVTRDPKITKALMTMWPTELLDSFYFAFVQKNLPKLRKGDTGQLQPSRDTKFLRSQKMATGRRKKIMKGWAKDNLLPPDRAVLHTRWYPTTKETWGKKRQGELVKRYAATKMVPEKVTRKTLL